MEVAPRRPNGWGKAIRLRKHAQYCRVQSKGRRIGGKFLLVIFAPSSFLDVRFGLTVSKHVGNAVTRNRVKRRLRDILRHQKSTLSRSSLDVVWIAKAEAASASYHALKQEVISLMQRILRSRSCTR
jgi:ribonuclease P protein component